MRIKKKTHHTPGRNEKKMKINKNPYFIMYVSFFMENNKKNQLILIMSRSERIIKYNFCAKKKSFHNEKRNGEVDKESRR